MMLFRAAESAQRSSYPCAILTRSRQDSDFESDGESGVGTVTMTQAAAIELGVSRGSNCQILAVQWPDSEDP
jgi:hypothetical protein